MEGPENSTIPGAVPLVAGRIHGKRFAGACLGEWTDGWVRDSSTGVRPRTVVEKNSRLELCEREMKELVIHARRTFASCRRGTRQRAAPSLPSSRAAREAAGANGPDCENVSTGWPPMLIDRPPIDSSGHWLARWSWGHLARFVLSLSPMRVCA